MKKQLFTLIWFLSINTLYAAQTMWEWDSVEQTTIQQQWSVFKAILENEYVSAVILCTVVMILTYFVAGVVRNRLTLLLDSYSEKLSWREEVQIMIVKSANIIVWLFWFSTAAWIIWLDLAIFMWGIWMWLWFWLQALLSNFISWLIIIFQWKFKVWDLIDIAWRMWNIRVMDTLFTEVEQFDWVKFYVPNAEFLRETVINVSANDKRRCEIVVWVDYDTDIVKAKQVINKVLWTFPNILTAPESKILLTEFDDSSIWLKIMFWLNINDDYFGTRSNVIETINLAFKQSNIKIPFPQITMSKRGE